MRHKLKHLNDSHKYNYKKYGATRTITISYDLLMELWHKQNGRCNLSKLPMFNILDDPLTISIDRIDSDIDYVNGNIQLVCQWVNLAKRNEDNLAMVDFMNKLRQRLMT